MTNENNFTERQQKIIREFESYRGNTAGRYPNLGSKLSGRSYGNNKDSLKKEIEQAAGDPKRLREISRREFKTNSGYIEVIEYFKNMYYYRYVVLPLFKGYKNKASRLEGEELRELSHSMIDLVDRLSFETLLPKQVEAAMVDGIVYLYTFIKNGKPIIISLPYNYCQRYRTTNFDTETVMFDFNYFKELFDEYKSQFGDTVTYEQLFQMFPSEMRRQFSKYIDEKNGKSNADFRYQELNIEHAAALVMHSDGVPPKILVSAAKQSYDNTVDIQKRKSANQIDSILTVEIPQDRDGLPIFTPGEAAAVQSLITSQISGIDGLKVMTSFGKVGLLKTQANESVKNDSVAQAYNQIFEEALINPELFRADTDYALQVSLNRDSAFVWTFLENLMNYYNLAINKLFSRQFQDYEAYIYLLPITKYNAADAQNEFRRAAEYGIGKLEAVVSFGIKQSAIYDKSELEKALELDDILLPLQSAHTRSGQLQVAEKKGTLAKEEPAAEQKKEGVKTEEEKPSDEVKLNEKTQKTE